MVVGKKMAPEGSGTVGRCGLVRACVVLLDKVCHCGGGWALRDQALKL